MTKYIFVTGGVVSSLGKGITASAIGQLLKNRGLKVFMQKFDPYLNVDPGKMSPYQHGEVYVTRDGAETDLDLGHYERFIDEDLNKHSSITAGKIYQRVLDNERNGAYGGKTVQVIPHVTNEIKKKLIDVIDDPSIDVVITEIGGTVGDIESLPFLEAIRQARRDFGYENTLYVHNTLLPYLRAAKEIKTKPTQHSVKELRSLGIQPDIIVLRSEVDVEQEVKEKIALFCDVDKEAVFVAKDVEVIYETILNLEEQNIDDYIIKHFKYEKVKKANLTEWENLINKIKKLNTTIEVGLIGKYIEHQDAYLSVNEALKHAGYYHNVDIKVRWINAEYLDETNLADNLKDCHAIIVPGGFGERGIKGKILGINYARTNNIPFFGISLGMQLAIVEYAQNVLDIKDANSIEFDTNTNNPVITKIKKDSESNLRLGSFECFLTQNTLAYNAYEKINISERHRHRYEFNNKYLNVFDNGDFIFSGVNKQLNLVEIIEIKNHIWFVGCAFHPEFTSRPLRPNPLFKDFIGASIKYKNKNK